MTNTTQADYLAQITGGARLLTRENASGALASHLATYYTSGADLEPEVQALADAIESDATEAEIDLVLDLIDLDLESEDGGQLADEARGRWLQSVRDELGAETVAEWE